MSDRVKPSFVIFDIRSLTQSETCSETVYTVLFQRVAGASPLVNCTTAADQQPKSSCPGRSVLLCGTIQCVDVRRSQSALTCV